MARIEVEITGNAKGLSNAANQGAAAMGNLSSSTNNASASTAKLTNEEKKLQAQSNATASGVNSLASANRNLNNSAKNLTNGISGANTVGIEFSRIIQDAPYGVIGIGNNITQLTQSFANLRAQTGSTSQALGIAFRSMFSGANLLVLGISAVTSAFTLYSMWAQRSKRETDDLDSSTKSYIDTLEGLQRAQADGLINAEKDIVNLRLLYEATQNLTLPMESRRKAAEELINQYPKQFQGLKTEAVLAGEAASAYDRLTQSITATAAALAAVDKIRENSNKILENRLQIIDKQNEANKLSAEIERQSAIAKNTRAFGSAGVGASSAAAYNPIARLEEQRATLLQEINELGEESGRLTGVNRQLQNEYNNQIAEGADLSGRLRTNLERVAKVSKDAAGYMRPLFGRNFADVGISRWLDRGPSSLPAVNVAQTAVVDMTTDPVWDAFVDDLDKQLGRAVSSFGRDFLRSIGSLAEDFRGDMSGAIGSVLSDLTTGLGEVISSVAFRQIEGLIGNAFKTNNLGQAGTWKAVGASIAGSIVSGVTGRTSVGGQALGGALSGAGVGATIGSVIPGIGTAIGAAAGAIVGALGGIFGASSARKRERAQEEMVKQQERTNALLERQNALAYASSIQGQMTSGGIVTGIMRDAFGQLVATVSGDQLQFVLQRSGGSR